MEQLGSRDIDGQVREGNGRAERERTSQILMRTDYVVNPSGLTYYYQDDHEGSVTHLTNASAAVLESYRYDAFGKATIYNASGADITSTGSAMGNRFMFTGREYIQQFGIYEYRARTYHPVLGRFMSEDPKGFDAGDYNLFRYCKNDPLDLTDPMGLVGAGMNGMPGQDPVEIHVREVASVTGSNIPVVTARADGTADASGNFSGRIATGGMSITVAHGSYNMAQVSVTTGNSSGWSKYPGLREPAEAGVRKAYGRMDREGRTREWGVEYGQSRSDPSKYVVTSPHPGPGAGDVRDKPTANVYQRFAADPGRLPDGYKMVGFGFAQVRFANGVNSDDRVRFDARGLVGLLAVPPKLGENRVAPYIYAYPER